MAITDGLTSHYSLENSLVDFKGTQDLAFEDSANHSTDQSVLGSYSVLVDLIGNIMSDGATYLSPSGDWTVAFWYYFTGAASSGNIFNIRSGAVASDQGNGILLVRFNGVGNNLNVLVRNTAGSLSQSDGTDNHKTANWKLFVIRREGNNLTCSYNNRAEVITVNKTGSWWETGDRMRLGRFNSGTEVVSGYYDLMDIWGSRSITIAEEAELWNGGAGLDLSAIAVAAGRRRRLLTGRN